ncbi:putative proline-rich protein PRCC [Lupinus albus]|uniref:Putative proline-rich protein PRCC n=1 Tax=Lupinus albus TaxID=3870 RepID=A0A6A4PJC4_LUPAL|nr:putative proline-rich protein PRCC [Lupinus albus]
MLLLFCVFINFFVLQPVSAKGKPSKLQKRKHQISSLYFDMKQNEMQLAERRAKGMLTKAETQAKYGW